MTYSAEKTLPVAWLDKKTPAAKGPRPGFETPTSCTA